VARVLELSTISQAQAQAPVRALFPLLPWDRGQERVEATLPRLQEVEALWYHEKARQAGVQTSGQL